MPSKITTGSYEASSFVVCKCPGAGTLLNFKCPSPGTQSSCITEMSEVCLSPPLPLLPNGILAAEIDSHINVKTFSSILAKTDYILPLDSLITPFGTIRHMHPEHYIPFHTRTNIYKFGFVPRTLINCNALRQQAVDIADTGVNKFHLFLQSL